MPTCIYRGGGEERRGDGMGGNKVKLQDKIYPGFSMLEAGSFT